MRKKIVAGNWKMNKDLQDAKILASEVIQMISDELKEGTEVVLIPPFCYLTTVQSFIGKMNGKVRLGAQNCSEHSSGAYTGEIAASQLVSVGVSYVIIGHSERREYYGETDGLLAKKIDQALQHHLIPIFCCGETLDIREDGKHFEHVSDQVKKSLFHLSSSDIKKVVIAYEPVWAIGTGVTATSDQAQEMHQVIRQLLEKHYGKEVAESISILYGGSVKPDSAADIFAKPDVDGGLIGGASLKSRDFVNIAKSF